MFVTVNLEHYYATNHCVTLSKYVYDALDIGHP